MRWITRIFVFTAALCLGTFVSSLFVAIATDVDTATIVVRRDTHLPAADLVGTWQGQWGRNGGDCAIEISRVRGNRFQGTLKKEGAEVLFEGTFDPATREVFFEEIKVNTIGPSMSAWSLGTNMGKISSDGRVMFGTGHDEWGPYAWAVSSHP